jgi:predicted nucleic acid-binding protein
LAISAQAKDHLEVIDLAAQARLTTYDASCLWLARKTGGKLVTLDKRLLKASGESKSSHPPNFYTA